jgi:leader peptidase (prepilin peptidase)/N-methyltransferase
MLAGVFLFPYWPYWPFLTYFFGALLASTFIDLDHWIIPDRITLPGIIIGFIGSFFHPTLPWLSSLLGILFGGGIFLVVGWLYEKLAKREGIGGGDVKFLAMIGAFLGFRGALITLILSSVLGSIIGLGLMWKRGRDAQMALPFGPFLALGALGSFFLGDAIWQWYFQWRI